MIRSAFVERVNSKLRNCVVGFRFTFIFFVVTVFKQNAFGQSNAAMDSPSTNSQNGGAFSQSPDSESNGASGDFLEMLWLKRVPQSSVILQLVKSKSKAVLDFDESWRMARFGVYLSQYIINQRVQSFERKEILGNAVVHANRAKKLRPNRVEGNYWLGLSLLSWSQEKGVLTLLGNAAEVRATLDAAVRADPAYFMGGPLRARGRLFSILPGFPFSFGDYNKAVSDFKKSLELFPNSKLSYLYLAESALENEGGVAFRKVMETARKSNSSMGELEDAAVRRAFTELEKVSINSK